MWALFISFLIIIIRIVIGSLAIWAIIFIMKKVLEVIRDERKCNLIPLVRKIILYELFLIGALIVLILSANAQITIPSISLAVGAALLCSYPLMSSAIRMGNKVYEKDYEFEKNKKSPILEFIKPWVAKEEKEIPWYQSPGSAIEKFLMVKEET